MEDQSPFAPIDPELQPVSALSMVHPWFEKSMCRQRLGDRIVYRLARIPESVVATLRKMEGASFDSAFGILNPDFWADLRNTQASGLDVLFIERVKGHEVAGFYSSEAQVVAFDVFADPGVITHELRHHAQALRPQDGAILGPKCAQAASLFLGELDATTVQLPKWEHRFDDVQPVIGGHGRIREYPQVLSFDTNLAYPRDSSLGLKGSDCPTDFVRAVKEITSKTTLAAQRISNLTLTIAAEVAHVERLRTEERRICQLGRSQSCEQAAAETFDLVRRIEDTKVQLNTLIRTESKARKAYIQASFGRMSEETQRLMYRASGAYQLMVERQ